MDKKKDAALAAEPQPFMTLNVTDWHNGTKSYAFDGYLNNLPIGAYPLYTAPQDQDAKDAARYRFLKGADYDYADYCVGHMPEEWDAKIDAAMYAQIVKVMSEQKWEDV